MSVNWGEQLAQLGDKVLSFLSNLIGTALDVLGPWLPTLIVVGVVGGLIGFLAYRFRDIIGGIFETFIPWFGY